jgi:tetratricopeptide (TPR) repeat protein
VLCGLPCRLVLGKSASVESADPHENAVPPGWTFRSAEAVYDLFQAGHYEQALAQGARVLEQKPEDEWTHYVMALAQLNLQRGAKAWNHVDCLLVHYPNWGPSHHAACLYFKGVGRAAEALRHIQTAIALDPTTAAYHSVSAILALDRNELPRARASIERARELDPQDPDIIRLAVEIRGLNQTSAREAWERIRELEAALALDPNNAGLHASIGSIFLDELDQPREAEESFRTALLNDPADRDHQAALFRAVGQQRILYRLLSIPQRAFAWMANFWRALSLQPWRIIFLVGGLKVVLAYFFWLLVTAIVFWPSCKIYEWLIISEIQCVAGTSARRLRWKRALNRWPFWARFGACAGLILGSWFALFAAMGILTEGFTVLGVFVGIHFVLTLALFVLRKARSSHGRWAADRKQKRKSVPPPLPKRI